MSDNIDNSNIRANFDADQWDTNARNDGEEALFDVHGQGADQADTDNFRLIEDKEIADVKGSETSDSVNGDMQQDNATPQQAIIDGTSADDTLTGSSGDDVIHAGDGSDTVDGGDGDDVIYGDSGDTGNSDAGNGDAGNGGDVLPTDVSATGLDDGTGSGNAGSGGAGSGGTGGGSGDDACDLTQGVGPNGDTILGGNGADTISGMSGQDYLSGGNGDDTISGGTGDDHILGDNGNDTLDGGDGDDCIEGGAGNDTIITGAGADHVDGGDDRDTIHGNAGDTIDGGAGGDDFDTLVVRDVDHIEYTSDDGEDGIVHFNDGETLEFEDIEEIVPCFTPGSVILTSVGEKRVEDLRLGDKVVTRDNGVQEIRWIGTKRVNGRMLLENPHLRPVLIRKGALGKGLPERDMTVSPNHRMLVANEKTTLLFEEREVLVAAKHLVNDASIQQIDSVGVSYIHMLFDEHEVILGDGSWTESFQPGDYSLKGVGTAQRNEIFELFPELRQSHGRKKYVAARRSLKRKEASLLH